MRIELGSGSIRDQTRTVMSFNANIEAFCFNEQHKRPNLFSHYEASGPHNILRLNYNLERDHFIMDRHSDLRFHFIETSLFVRKFNEKESLLLNICKGLRLRMQVGEKIYYESPFNILSDYGSVLRLGAFSGDLGSLAKGPEKGLADFGSWDTDPDEEKSDFGYSRDNGFGEEKQKYELINLGGVDIPSFQTFKFEVFNIEETPITLNEEVDFTFLFNLDATIRRQVA